MKSVWRILCGILALMCVGLVFVWSNQPVKVISAARVAGGAPVRLGSSSTLPFTFTVSGPYTPTLSVAVRDLPADPNLPTLSREPIQRDGRGFVGPDIQMPPHGNLLADLQQSALAPAPNDFTTPILNFAGIQSSSSPPDDTGDVGPNHYLQGDNGPGGSRVTIYDKSGTQLAQFDMEDLATTSPCNNGYCDPIIQYDELADRWMIAEFDSSANTLCVYVSRTPDPTGQWWAYAFDPPGGGQDYPKYAVWPDGYYIAANNGGTIIVLERNDMINGQPATMQTFALAELPGFGFQLSMPATLEGDAPPAGEPAFFLRPRDTEVHGGVCTNCDLMEMWSLHIDWTTPANSSLTSLPGIQLTDWDHTLCGTGSTWNCMPQPGTSQKIDPIREPVHYPLQYRNFGAHETLVGCFAEDVDGTDQAAVHWFEIRRTPPGSGNWVNYQEGVIGDGLTDVHRSVCSAAMDSAGNIAVGYTRTGGSAPYYPSIYYSGRLASDPLGTMPYYDAKIWDATNSNTDNERWGDYSGIGVDPADGCTFWYTTEYGGSGQTRIAAFKFDECGTPDFTMNVSPDVLDICAPDDAVYTVSVGAVSAFSNTVTLTSTGRPSGTTELFVPNPVTPASTSIFTVGNTGGAAPGSYTIVVVGAAAGSSGHQGTVVLNLFTTAPGAATLLLPADGATGVSTKPTFDWSDVGNTSTYEIEVATDPDFVNIVDSAAGLAASTYTPAGNLTMDTVYYWRVRAVNACESVVSVVRAFRTAASGCVTYVSTDVPKTINDYTWVTSTLAVPDSFNVTDVDVILDSVTHTYDGDLDIYIRHPDTTEVELSTDNGSLGDNYTNTRFDDEAATPITSGSAPFTGSFRPEGSLATLDGKTANGAWALRIYDDAGSDTGTLNGWSLVVCGTGSAVTGDYSDLAHSYGVAWHAGDGALRLGANWTLDSLFAPPGYDDASDDGVTFPNGLVPGQPNLVRVNVQGTPTYGRWLRLWFDWNGDGIFGTVADGERVYNAAVNNGNNDIIVDVPGTLSPPMRYRARLYDSAGSPLRDVGSWGGADGGEVEDYSTIIQCTAGLDLQPPTAAQSGAPGMTVTYTLRVTNTGDCGDTFTVTVGGNAWPTNAPAVVGPVASNGSAPVNITVDIPGGANVGDWDDVIVTLTSQIAPTTTASSVLTTTAVEGCVEVTGVDLAMVTTGTIYIGDPVDFAADIIPDDFTAPYSYTVDYGDGTGPVSGGSATDPLLFSHSYTTVNTYTVELAVWNCAMVEPLVDTVVVTMCKPVADAAFSWTPITPTVGQAVNFDGSASGDGLSFEWAFGDDDTANVQDPTHTYTAGDDYTVVMTATGDCGEPMVITHTIHVCEPVADAAFNWTPITPTVGQAVNLDGSASGDGLSFEWAFGDDGTANVQDPTHTYTTADDYTVVMTATGDCGEPMVVTHTITVQAVCEQVTEAGLATLTSGDIYTDTEVEFSVALTPTTATTPYSYQVTVDGAAGSTLTASAAPFTFTHTFATTGTHVVVVAVWNCDMTIADAVTNTVDVNVIAHPIQPPTFYIYLPIVLRN